MTLKSPEFLENPENRCPVVLLLDTSASMEGDPIRALNEGLATFKFDVEQDEIASLRVEVAIITFGDNVSLYQSFVTIDDFTAPVLQTAGKTPLGRAMELGLEVLEERKKAYKEAGIGYYRPWMFLITDGAPTDGEIWKKAAANMQGMVRQNKLAFFTVGVEGADQEILSAIAPEQFPPFRLRDLEFSALFKWLSASVRRVSVGHVGLEMLALPASQGWVVK